MLLGIGRPLRSYLTKPNRAALKTAVQRPALRGRGRSGTVPRTFIIYAPSHVVVMAAPENLVEGPGTEVAIAAPLHSDTTFQPVSLPSDAEEPTPKRQKQRPIARPSLVSRTKSKNGSFSVQGIGRPLRNAAPISAEEPRSKSHSPLRIPIASITPGQLAFSAMQYLPVPVLVLNGLKTVTLANEAMGRMLGLVSDTTCQDDATIAVDKLRGQTLSQVGVDMLQDGRPVWISWEAFLDSLVDEMGIRPPAADAGRQTTSGPHPGDVTPTMSPRPSESHRRSMTLPSQDAVIEVVVSRKDIGRTSYDGRHKVRNSDAHVFAQMIITVWEIEDRQTFFTLTFTNASSTASTPPHHKKIIAKPSVLEAADRRTIASSTASSVASSRDSGSPSFHSPGIVTMSSSPFPPMGPPSTASHTSAPSVLQKINLMKDALLDNTQMPVLAMWKDGSVTFPNKAARLLLPPDSELDSSTDGLDILKHWGLWNDDFTRKLELSEYPMSVLLRTESPFESMRIGVIANDGKKLVHDVLGEAIRDDTTGEFLAGVVTGRDVTIMSEEITQIKVRDEERFKHICDTMPQLVWTANADGRVDFFNTRWYTYTGLAPEECMGSEWQVVIHPEDQADAWARWSRSIETGEPYMTEYRVRSGQGDYRWFLGRALAVTNKDTGEVEKWLGKMTLLLNGDRGADTLMKGTCTDVHESIETKFSAKRTRQQLLSVIAHSQVTIFTVDTKRCVTMLEGALIWNNTYEDGHESSRWYIGENMYTVFNRLAGQVTEEGEQLEFLRPIENILAGNATEDVREHGLGGCPSSALKSPCATTLLIGRR